MPITVLKKTAIVNRSRTLFLLLTLAMEFLIHPHSDLQGAYILKNGKLYNERYIASFTADEHFGKGVEALKTKCLEEAEIQFKIVEKSFPDSTLAADACYYLGVIKYELAELDVANRYFNTYLIKKNVPEHYEDVFRYKMAIASRLAKGEKRHLFGKESLPKLMTGRQIALDLFDEIIKTMPYQELAAQATLEKGDLLQDREEFSKAIDCYQHVIRKFPRTQFALSAFQAISQAYKKQLVLEPQNSDALALAEINIREAKQMFFSAEEITLLVNQVEQMKEGVAISLFETGKLYERMGEPKAAVLCYSTLIQKFPETAASNESKLRLKELSKYAHELSISTPTV